MATPIFQAKVNSAPGDMDDLEAGKWYFYDESWAYILGPFDTEEEAHVKLVEYVLYLNGQQYKDDKHAET